MKREVSPIGSPARVQRLRLQRVQARAARRARAAEAADAPVPSSELIGALDDCDALLTEWGALPKVLPQDLVATQRQPTRRRRLRVGRWLRRARVTVSSSPGRTFRALRRLSAYTAVCAFAGSLGWLVAHLFV